MTTFLIQTSFRDLIARPRVSGGMAAPPLPLHQPHPRAQGPPTQPFLMRRGRHTGEAQCFSGPDDEEDPSGSCTLNGVGVGGSRMKKPVIRLPLSLRPPCGPALRLCVPAGGELVLLGGSMRGTARGRTAARARVHVWGRADPLRGSSSLGGGHHSAASRGCPEDCESPEPAGAGAWHAGVLLRTSVRVRV